MANFNPIIGAPTLPYVHCKKIILENNNIAPETTDIILKLELRVKKKDLLNSWWLQEQNLVIDNTTLSLLDALFVQIFATDALGTHKLRPSWHPDLGNMYTDPNVQFPRGSFGDEESTNGSSWIHGYPYSPIQISVSSLLGNLNEVILSDYVDQGKVREEYLPPANELYYIIPFSRIIPQIVHPDYDGPIGYPASWIKNFGLGFYTFFHVPYMLSQIPGLDLLPDEFKEAGIIKGPISTEILFLGGQTSQRRDQFVLPGGTMWEGSVHLHTSDNPGPGNYFGNGGYGLNKGWMVGKEHILDVEQPKLMLTEIPNHKINDLRVFGKPSTQSVIGPNFGSLAGLASFWEDFGEITIPTGTDALSVIAGSSAPLLDKISPYQRENKKYFLPSDKDNEFSKLYITRDINDNAHGLFFINFRNWLLNNSKLYNMLFTEGAGMTGVTLFDKASKGMIEGHYLPEILRNTEILELKLYRDRIKEHNLEAGPENYNNDKYNEEPSTLLDVVYDQGEYGTLIQKTNFREVALNLPEQSDFEYIETFKAPQTRYFTFSDQNQKNAGLYQYRIEAKIKDGTIEFLNAFLNKLLIAKRLLDAYLFLATSYDIENKRPYYDNGSFTTNFVSLAYDELVENVAMIVAAPWIQSQLHSLGFIPDGQIMGLAKEWLDEAAAEGYVPEDPIKAFLQQTNEGNALISAAIADSFVETPIWRYAPYLLNDIRNIFGISPAADQADPGNNWGKLKIEPDPTLMALLDPNYGSLEGIQFTIKLFSSCIEKIQSLVGAIKQKPGGSDLTKGNSTTLNMVFNNAYNFKVSPKLAIIEDSHTFNSPEALFRKATNKDIYVDYLSVGSYSGQGQGGLRVMAAGTYINRCKSELYRFYNYELSAFNGGGVENDSSDMSGYGGYIPASATGYQFLAPSIIKMSDPGSTSAYHSYLTVFSPKSSVIANKIGELSSGFSDINRYDKLLANLANYTHSKEILENASFSQPFRMSVSKPGDLFGIPENSRDLYETRESFKNLAAAMGLTLHSRTGHADWFNIPAGARQRPVGAPATGDIYPLGLEGYSDKTLLTSTYIKGLVTHEKSLIGVAKGQTDSSPGVVGKPNNFKIVKMYKSGQWPYANNVPNITKLAIDNKNSYNSFVFFNFNMTRKIEVYTGLDASAYPQNDEDSWSALTKSRLDSLETDGQPRYLFCRIKAGQNAATRGIRAPLVDKYFLISSDFSTLAYESPTYDFEPDVIGPGVKKYKSWKKKPITKKKTVKKITKKKTKKTTKKISKKMTKKKTTKKISKKMTKKKTTKKKKIMKKKTTKKKKIMKKKSSNY